MMTCRQFTPFFHDAMFPFAADRSELPVLRHLVNLAAQRDDRRKRHSTVMQPNYRCEADGSGVLLEIELPGVEKKDIAIEVKDQKLVVTGKRFRTGATVHMKATTHEGHEGAGKDVMQQDCATDNDGTLRNAADEEKAETQQDVAEELHKEASRDPVPSVIYELETRIGHGIDEDSVRAEHSGNGMLMVYLGRRTERKARRVNVS